MIRLTTVLVAILSLLAATSAAASGPTRILDCAGRPTVKPAGIFVLSCADANAELVHTRWTAWTARSATGTATVGLNLCVPNCAASKMSFFAHSRVHLTGVKHGLFTRVVVTYTLHGKRRTFVGYPRTS